jgi:hypothetical protein
MNIPQLTIEMEEDGTVLLEQEWCGESDRIQLHPIHIRHLAELVGLLEPLKPRPQVPGSCTPAAAAVRTNENGRNGYPPTVA